MILIEICKIILILKLLLIVNGDEEVPNVAAIQQQQQIMIDQDEILPEEELVDQWESVPLVPQVAPLIMDESMIKESENLLDGNFGLFIVNGTQSAQGEQVLQEAYDQIKPEKDVTELEEMEERNRINKDYIEIFNFDDFDLEFDDILDDENDTKPEL